MGINAIKKKNIFSMLNVLKGLIYSSYLHNKYLFIPPPPPSIHLSLSLSLHSFDPNNQSLAFSCPCKTELSKISFPIYLKNLKGIGVVKNKVYTHKINYIPNVYTIGSFVASLWYK